MGVSIRCALAVAALLVARAADAPGAPRKVATWWPRSANLDDDATTRWTTSALTATAPQWWSVADLRAYR